MKEVKTIRALGGASKKEVAIMAKREMKKVNVEAPVNENEEIVNTDTPVEEAPKPKKVKKVIGVVANCGQLNVRYKPDPAAIVVNVLNVGDEVEIVMDKSTNDFYRVQALDLSFGGFCMTKYITIK